MVVFIAALFAPNTVGFHSEPESSSAKTSGSLSKKEKAKLEDYLGSPTAQEEPRHDRSQSLTQVPTFSQSQFVQTPAAIGRTPGATTTTEDIFRPFNNTAKYKLSIPEHPASVQTKSSASLHTLTALDSQIDSWGKNGGINQPKSLAQSPPSQSIFNDATTHVKGSDDIEPIFAKAPPKPVIPSKKKKDFVYTTDNYAVQTSTLGNAGLIGAVNAIADQEELADVLWVGTLGMPTDALPSEVKTHIAEKLENEYATLIVFTDDTDMNAHYENYCKTILWPLFHSQVPDTPKSKAYQDNSWKHYARVNESFAECIVKNYKKGDVVWVNDYHLMLVPRLVRKHFPDAQIGMYIHSSFPPSEVFRILPSRSELIRGMLGANMIAFQTEDFRYQFLQTCSRLLNIEATEHGLVLENGRVIDVFNIPMGIDIQAMKMRREFPEVKDWMKELGEKFAGKRIIVSRDKLDGVHGIQHKLRGYRALLERYPEWADQVVLVQIATSVTTDRDLKEDINDNITAINSEWGSLSHQPVVYLNRDIDYSQYLALLAIADCMLITSLSEGMNLACHEFVVSQDQALSLKGHAPLIISESIGAAKVFRDSAVLINPWHPKGVADALNKALKMSKEEKAERWQKMYALTEEHSARKWFETYLTKLELAWKEHSTRDPKSVPRLQIKQLRRTYDRSNRRLLIIDFEGTLTTWDTPKETVVTVPLRVLELLRSLVDDEKNAVYVMSQQPMDGLEHMFRSIPKLGLIAENGAFLRKTGRQDWQSMTEIDTKEWREGIMSMLKAAETAIPGSVTRELKSGIMFHYVDAEDQNDAFEKAGELANQINEMCEQLGVSAVPFDKGLYIHPSKVNKGLPMKVIEAEHFKKAGANKPDFIFAIGDSNDDEAVFKWAHQLKDRVDEDRIFTCAVGNRSTTAKTALTQGTGAVVLTFEKLALHDVEQAA